MQIANYEHFLRASVVHGGYQGLKRSPHLRSPISNPPSQAPISGHHLRPPTSDPPPQTLQLSPLCVTFNPLLSPLTLIMVRVFLIQRTLAGLRLQREISNIRGPKHQQHYLGGRPPRETTISGLEHPHPIPHFNKIVQYQTPRFSCEITMSDPTLFVRDYNIRPRQCHTPRFSRETTISGPEHDTYNLRPHAFRARLQYQAPTITFFARDYNIRPRT